MPGIRSHSGRLERLEQHGPPRVVMGYRTTFEHVDGTVRKESVFVSGWRPGMETRYFPDVAAFLAAFPNGVINHHLILGYDASDPPAPDSLAEWLGGER